MMESNASKILYELRFKLLLQIANLENGLAGLKTVFDSVEKVLDSLEPPENDAEISVGDL